MGFWRRKMQADEYSIEIFYSEEDEGYIAMLRRLLCIWENTGGAS